MRVKPLLEYPPGFGVELLSGGDCRAELDLGVPEGSPNVTKVWFNDVLVFDRAMGGWLVDPETLKAGKAAQKKATKK